MKKMVLMAFAAVLGLVFFIGCAGNNGSDTNENVEPAAVCDSLSASFGRNWTLLREGNEGEAPFYTAPIAFLDQFQMKFAPTCFNSKTKEEIIAIVGKPTLTMYYGASAPADTLLRPEFCYRGFTKDTQMEFTICAFFDSGSKQFKQFSFTRPDLKTTAPNQ